MLKAALKNYLIFSLLVLVVVMTGCSGKSSGGPGDEFGKNGDGSGRDGFRDGNIPYASGASGALSDVNFRYDSSGLSSDSRETLRSNADWLLNNQDQKVVIEGHCDERGTDEYNLALGERRG